jgi:hypothetical protein
MAFADGALDHGRALAVRTHVDACDVCAEDVADFTRLRAERRVSPPAAAVAAGPASGVSVPASRRVAAAALVAGAAGGLWWWSRPAGAPENDTVAQAPAAAAPVSPSPDASARGVVLTDGVVSLLADGSVRGLEGRDPDERGLVEAMLRDGLVPKAPDDGALRPPLGALMGGAAPRVTLRLTSPVGRVLETDRPAFTWTPVPDATAYRVAIYDQQLALQQESGPVTTPSWTATTPLRRGQIYLWQVEADTPAGVVRAPGPDAPEARFRVISAEDEAAIRAMASAGAVSRLALGARYAALGLHEAAAREFGAVADANRGSALAASLARAARARIPNVTP